MWTDAHVSSDLGAGQHVIAPAMGGSRTPCGDCTYLRLLLALHCSYDRSTESQSMRSHAAARRRAMSLGGCAATRKQKTPQRETTATRRESRGGEIIIIAPVDSERGPRRKEEREGSLLGTQRHNRALAG